MGRLRQQGSLHHRDSRLHYVKLFVKLLESSGEPPPEWWYPDPLEKRRPPKSIRPPRFILSGWRSINSFCNETHAFAICQGGSQTYHIGAVPPVDSRIGADTGKFNLTPHFVTVRR